MKLVKHFSLFGISLGKLVTLVTEDEREVEISSGIEAPNELGLRGFQGEEDDEEEDIEALDLEPLDERKINDKYKGVCLKLKANGYPKDCDKLINDALSWGWKLKNDICHKLGVLWLTFVGQKFFWLVINIKNLRK